ncbi:MAG: hypothetical protein U0W40_20235 [Acidimicrobiia bacterium]
MGVLAVEVDEAGARLRELRDGGQAAVDVGKASAVADHGQHDLVAGVGIGEAALDAAPVGPVAHEPGVGLAADQQLDRLDEQRLAMPVSPVIAVMPSPSTTLRSATIPRSTTWSSCSIGLPLLVREAELGLEDLVEVAART